MRQAIALALSYVEGFRTTGSPVRLEEADAFLEHLADSGFVVRKREPAALPIVMPNSLEARRISPREVRTMRTALGLGLVALSRLSGVSVPTIRAIENGRIMPRPKTITAVLDALGRVQAGAARRNAAHVDGGSARD